MWQEQHLFCTAQWLLWRSVAARPPASWQNLPALLLRRPTCTHSPGCTLPAPEPTDCPRSYTHKKEKKVMFFFSMWIFSLYSQGVAALLDGKKNIPHSLEKLSRNGGEEWCKAWHGGRGGDGEKSSREELKDRQDERLGEPWVRRGLRQQESGAKGKKKKSLVVKIK